MNTWIVPGAPLTRGEGWRIWFSRQDGNAQEPVLNRVERLGGGIEKVTTRWQLLNVPNVRRSFGILEIELDNPTPGAAYRLFFPEARDDSAQPIRPDWLEMRSLPASLPPEGLSFLFASCFWRDDDTTGGGYSGLVQDLVIKQKPAFKLLIGDQVYQDWPSSFNPLKSALDIYQGRYEDYWGARGYQDVLRSTPNYFLCDDHEFWNDFPERQAHLERTYTDASRKTYTAAALQLYNSYQQAANPGGANWYIIDLAPVSIFVADTRSERTSVSDAAPHFLSAGQWTGLEAWFRNLRGPGVLVVGQPVFQKDGDFKDHSLSNFKADYERLGRLIADSHKGRNQQGRPHQILILSGDIHCGRLCVGRIAGVPDAMAECWEFITSPISRISPYISTPSPEKPRELVQGDPNKGHKISVSPAEGVVPTIHNNVGMVRMVPLASGSVRFELTLHCVRPYNHTHFWEVGVEKSSFPRPGAVLLRKEITLG